MAFSNLTNGGEGTLAAGISSVATTATCTTGHGARLPASGSVLLGIWNRTDYPVLADAIRAGHGEYVLATRSGETLTLTRGQEGTTPVALNVAGKTYAFRSVISAGMIGALASKDGVETLTNKTIHQVGAPVFVPNAMGSGTVINTGSALNIKTISADTELSYSSTPSVAGTQFRLSIYNSDSSRRKVTLPASPPAFNVQRHENVTEFYVPPAGQAELEFTWDGFRLITVGINDSQYLSGRPTIQSATLMGSLRRATITQTAHGFTKGQCVRHNGTAWVLAIATGSLSASLPAGVIETFSTDSFDIVPHGRIDLDSLALTPGTKFLSSTVAGQIVDTSPAIGSSGFQTTVLRVVSATEIYVAIGDPLPLGKIPGSSIQLDTDINLSANSDEQVPSQKAVKTYIDSRPGSETPNAVTAPEAFTEANRIPVAAGAGRALKKTPLYIDEEGNLVIPGEFSGSITFKDGSAESPKGWTMLAPKVLAADVRAEFPSTARTGFLHYLKRGESLTGSLAEIEHTATGVTGARTINCAIGSVNFAAGATSVVVTNTLATEHSVVVPVIIGNDATAAGLSVDRANGSFTLRLKTAPTAETRIAFVVF